MPNQGSHSDSIPAFLSDHCHEACYLLNMAKTQIGVMAHNEAGNLRHLLERLLAEPGDHHVCVVSSGSTDKTNDIAREMEANSPRVRLITEPARRGKARAINRFLAELDADTQRVVIVSGDVLPEPGSLAHLLAPLDDPQIHMTGARPCPMNPQTGWINRVVHFQWDLLDNIARRTPKLGEMVAFRPPIEPLDPNTVVDEAALEAQLTHETGRLAYVPEALVLNLGPRTLTDLVAQRERIWIGHLRLHQRTGYRVSTFSLKDLFISALCFLAMHPRQLPVAMVAAAIEGIARMRGSYHLHTHGELPTVWPRQLSAKIL